MGAWGPGIKQNDLFGDVYDTFRVLYYDGLEPKQIREILERENEVDEDEYADFWTAIAYSQWMTRGLEKYVLDKIGEIMESGRGLQLWKDAGDKEFTKRKKVLDAFYSEIQTKRPTAIKRIKIKPYPPVFEKGNCLTFQLDDNNYGAAVVIEKIDFDPLSLSRLGSNRIALTKYKATRKPELKDILASEILYTSFRKWNEAFNVNTFDAKELGKDLKQIERIGNVDISDTVIEFIRRPGRCFNFDNWKDVRSIINSQLLFEIENPLPDHKKLRVADITNNADNWRYMLDERYKYILP
jgi:hypothetical protein